jgi:hypothetical protein
VTAFHLFSDDLEIAGKELQGIGVPIIPVAPESGTGDAMGLDEFYLMYKCDHAIVADSTFSWWAAWLSETPGKIVVAPQGLSPWGSDWIPPTWRAIPAAS